MEDNTTIDDFYSIGLGFTNKSDVPETQNVTENKDLNNNDESFIDSIDKNNSLADKVIDEEKEKNEIIVETVSKDSDSVIETNNISAESYRIDMGFEHKSFSLEDAYYALLTTENINKASDTELKAVGNMLILLKKHIGLTNRRYFEGFDNPSNIILKNLIASKTSICAHNSYLKYKVNSIETIFDNLLEFLNNFTNKGNVGDIVSSLQLLGEDILNVFDKLVPGIKVNIIAGSKSVSEQLSKLNELLSMPVNTPNIITNELFGIYRVQKDTPIGSVVDSIETIDNVFGAFRKLIDMTLSDKYSTSITNINECVSKNDISIDINDKMIVELVTETIYKFVNVLMHFYHHVIEDCKCLSIALNKDLTETKSKENLENKGESDPFVVSDYHLIDDLLIGDNQLTRSNKLIEKHNKFITNNDDVIFLGDLSGSETFMKGNETLPDKLKSLVKQLNHRKMIIILGNNDFASQTNFYKDCGFDEVYENPVLIQNPRCCLPDGINKLLLSHEPVNLGNNDDILNIHGHLHGCKKYYGVNCENHIDVFYSLYPRPMRLSEIIEFFKSGKYNGLKSVEI